MKGGVLQNFMGGGGRGRKSINGGSMGGGFKMLFKIPVKEFI